MEDRAHSDTDVLLALETYVPPYVRWRLVRKPSLPVEPFEDVYSAAVVHADIAGFTPMAEKRAAEGVAGAEHVGNTLGLFFSELGNIVAAHDGHTLAFAGDAATVMWPVTATSDLADAVQQAICCCVALRNRLDQLKVDDTALSLRVHLSVAAGQVRTAAIGGMDGRWLPTVYGPVFEQLRQATLHAGPGQIVASAQAGQLAGLGMGGERLSDGTMIVTGAPPARPSRRTRQSHVPSSALPALRACVPPNVRARLEAGGVDWHAEFRHATVAFIHARSASMTEPGDLESLHRHVQPVQAAISAAGGSVNKVLAERSGLTVLAAWGLLQHAHEDNSVRALRASLVSRERLLACGADASIGVATGRIFAGAVGTDDHKEYAVLGDVVNIAARLAHDGPPGIRCDGATRVEARSRILFESATTTKLRGRSDPVAVYTPLAEKPIRRDANVLLGREREREQLRRACDMLEAGHGGVVAIEGEAGIGKSRLVTDLIEWTQQRPVQSLIGWGESVERATPYHAWRQVFTRLLRLDTVGDRNAQRAAVLAALATPERQARVALANVVLPLDFPETAESESLKPAARARAARDLLVYLFEHFTHGRPTVLVFEDAQWMDSASWALLHDLSQTDAAVLAVMASRPVLADQMSPDWRSLRDAESTLRIRLEALTPSDALALACLRLDVDVLPAEVAGRVIQVAEGHPFFTEQLVLAMRDTDRVISVDQGECRIVSPLSTLTFAGTVHALVDSRIDSLTVQQQDTLKVAAVLGRRFDLWSLRAMHPGNPEAGELRKQLDTLVDLELLRVDDGVVGRTYRFKHAITQEAVSGWLLPSERRNLNARVARLLEEQHPADLTPVHARLAHHWREAGVVSKANDYLELAAQRALREDANQEALEFLEQALRGAQNGDAGQPGNAVRQAVWKRQSAEASWVMGDTLRARQYVEEAKRELRHAPRPAGRELATQLLIRAGRMFVPRRFVVTTDVAERQRLLEASRIAGLSALLNIDPVDQLAASADALLSYNLAERAGSTNVHALGMIGYAAGAIGLRGLARSHFARMHEEAQKHNDLRPLMFVLLLESMSVFSEGRIADAERSLREGLEWAGPAGNQRDRARLLLLLGAITCFSGKMRDGSLLVREAYGLAKYEDEASVERSWSLICLAGANAQHLPAADSLEAFHDLREKVRESVARDTVAHSGSDNHLRMATSQALEALIYVRAGRVDDAMRSAEGALRFFGSTRNLFGTHPTAWILVQGLFEALWAAWDAASHSDAKSAAHVETHARRYSRMLGRFAWMNPVYRPRALLFRGQVEWRRGRRRKAVELWQRSLDRAETLAAVQGEGGDRTFMFDRALAHLVLSRATATGQVDPRRLARSIDLFKQCEMPYFEHEADAALPLASARARP